MSLTVTGAAGATFPGGDLCSGTGTTVTVGSGLSLAGGTLSASAGGGITQLTGDTVAGPGSGSVPATTSYMTGLASGGAQKYFVFRDAVGSFLIGATPPAAFNKFIGYDINTAEVWLGAGYNNDNGADKTYVFAQKYAYLQILDAGIPIYAAKLAYQRPCVLFSGAQINSARARLTGAPYTCDATQADYYLECAYAAGSGGQQITLPANLWPVTGGFIAGRTFVVADILGTCDPGDPITVIDPSGRTFNGAAGPLVVGKHDTRFELQLDTTGTNWIVAYYSGTPI